MFSKMFETWEIIKKNIFTNWSFKKIKNWMADE